MKNFSHLDGKGKAQMVDVSEKPVTLRYSEAEATVMMSPPTLKKIKKNEIKKGDVLAAAKLAAIMAAKRTSSLIPLAHPIKITHAGVQFSFVKNAIRIISRVKALDTTGCEMEALVMAAVAGLTVYDMIKGADRSAGISDIRLLEKSGGKSGLWKRK